MENPFTLPYKIDTLRQDILSHNHTCDNCDVDKYIQMISGSSMLCSDGGQTIYCLNTIHDIIYCLIHIFNRGVSHKQQEQLCNKKNITNKSIPLWYIALIESDVILSDDTLLVIKKYTHLMSIYECSKKNTYNATEFGLILRNHSKSYITSKIDIITIIFDDPTDINIFIKLIVGVQYKYEEYIDYNIIKQTIHKYKEYISEETIQYIYVYNAEKLITLAKCGVIINGASLDFSSKCTDIDLNMDEQLRLYTLISQYNMQLTFCIFKKIYTYSVSYILPYGELCDITKKNIDDNNVDSILVHFFASIIYDNNIELHKIINKYNKIVFSQESLEKAYILRSKKCIQYILNNKIIPTNKTFTYGHHEFYNILYLCVGLRYKISQRDHNLIPEIKHNLMEAISFGFIPDKMTIEALIRYDIIIPEISRFNIDPTDIFKICVKYNYFPKEYTIIMENNIQLKFRLMHNNKKTSKTIIEKYMKKHEIDIDEYCIFLCFKNNKVLFDHYENVLKLDIPLVCLLMDPIKDRNKRILINYIDKHKLFTPFI